jgi:putative oxidoreductase
MTPVADLTTLSTGLLIQRLVLGVLMMAHSSQKLFGWLGGYGIAGTAGFFEGLGFRPGRPYVLAASLSELIGGLLIALGFLGPVGPALIISVMIVAAVTVHWGHGLFAGTNGIEVPLLYSTGSLALALTGPGLYSLDAALELSRVWTPGPVLAVVALGILGAVGNLLLRRPVPAAQSQTS